MSFDVSSLEEHIRKILNSPSTNPETMGAKRIRKMLTPLVPELTPDILKQYKDEIDSFIVEVYTQLKAEGELDEQPEEDPENAEVALGEGSNGSRKRKHEESDEGNGDEDEAVESTRPEKKAKAKEEEGESSKTKARKTRTVAKKGGRPRKSAATVDSEAESEGGKKKRSRKKSTTGEGGGARGGFAKEFTLSEPLAKVLRVEKLSRPQVVKQLWVYIKDKNLQNPQNKREILLDTDLKAVFGREKIDMFSMNKVLSNHLLKE